MNKTIHVSPGQVPAALRVNYSGSKFRLEAAEDIYIPADAGLWSGGSRDVFTAIEIATGVARPLTFQASSPWDSSRFATDTKMRMRPGWVIARDSIFCGKDTGRHITVHPSDLTPLLPPPPADLSAQEKITLGVIRALKSRARAEAALRNGVSQAEFDAAKQRLIDLGFLTKAGAVTPSGRNVDVGHVAT